MFVTDSIAKIREIVWKRKIKDNAIGYVPTMGYLHEGHLSLIREAVKKNDYTVVSIYVNPTQFAPDEDFDQYPRDIQRDIKLCEQEGVDLIFNPSDKTMYSDNFQTYVVPGKLNDRLCGEARPGFFKGVCTIVTKLFNIVNPDNAYFGQKDYQQYKIIDRMVKDLNMNVKINACEIVRESDGLAISSRNKYLSKKERKESIVLYKSLKKARQMLDSGEKNIEKIKDEIKKMINKKDTTDIDYIEIVNEKKLENIENISEVDRILIALAVNVGSARLIDNTVWGKDGK